MVGLAFLILMPIDSDARGGKPQPVTVGAAD